MIKNENYTSVDPKQRFFRILWSGNLRGSLQTTKMTSNSSRKTCWQQQVAVSQNANSNKLPSASQGGASRREKWDKVHHARHTDSKKLASAKTLTATSCRQPVENLSIFPVLWVLLEKMPIAMQVREFLMLGEVIVVILISASALQTL